MDASITSVGVTMFLLLAFTTVGGPTAVTDWLRRRRQRVAKLQIALTDAIHGRLGAIVSPVVKKPLRAPWEIAISVPVGAPETTGTILAIVNHVVVGMDGVRADAYRVVLTPQQGPSRAAREPRERLSPKPWTGHPMGAA